MNNRDPIIQLPPPILSVTKHGFVFWALSVNQALNLRPIKRFSGLTFLTRHMIVWISCFFFDLWNLQKQLVFWKPWPVTGHIATANLKSTTFLLFYWMPIEILYFSSGVWTFKYVLSLTLKKNHRAFLSCCTVCYAVQGGSNFCFGAWNPDVWSFKIRVISSILRWYCLLNCTRWFHLLVFWSDLLMKSLSIP